MPKLLAFLPCQSVVPGAKHDWSLIGLFSGLTVPVQANSQMPLDTLMPIEWAAVTVWKPIHGDEGRDFIQYMRLRRADDVEIRTQAFPPFRFDGRKPYRIVSRMKGMPIAIAGWVSLEVWLESGTSAVTEQHVYPIAIAHQIQ